MEHGKGGHGEEQTASVPSSRMAAHGRMAKKTKSNDRVLARIFRFLSPLLGQRRRGGAALVPRTPRFVTLAL